MLHQTILLRAHSRWLTTSAAPLQSRLRLLPGQLSATGAWKKQVLGDHQRLIVLDESVDIKPEASWIEGQKLKQSTASEFRGHDRPEGRLTSDQVRAFFTDERMSHHIGCTLSGLLNSNIPWKALIGVHSSGRVQGIETSSVVRKEIEIRWTHHVVGLLTTLSNVTGSGP